MGIHTDAIRTRCTATIHISNDEYTHIMQASCLHCAYGTTATAPTPQHHSFNTQSTAERLKKRPDPINGYRSLYQAGPWRSSITYCNCRSTALPPSLLSQQRARTSAHANRKSPPPHGLQVYTWHRLAQARSCLVLKCNISPTTGTSAAPRTKCRCPPHPSPQSSRFSDATPAALRRLCSE